MVGLKIFIVITLAGCAFLLYFLYALWRDGRKCRKRTRVEIIKLPGRRKAIGKLLRLYNTEELRDRKRL